MKLCPNCKRTYADDANFCPEEGCATADGPRRLVDAHARRFQPRSRVGGQQTGEVWRATDAQTGQDVAYKVVAPDIVTSEVALGRVEREAKQLLRVSNPRIAQVIEVERTADGRLIIASEWVDGETLEAFLKRGPVTLDRAKALVGQIGQGLLEAQKAGVVHRDLAPKNVLLTATGDVKLINFALAKPISDRVSGTAGYLSPEQAQGRAPDQRSNTYNLAAIFYHLVTGEPPFASDDPKVLLDLHISSPPLAPSQRRSDASLSPETDKVILKALDKNSSRRQLTLRVFLAEVEALAATVAPSAAPAAPATRDAGFAKTMLFAGGQAEVQKMVANAIASRNASAAKATPVPPVTAVSSPPSSAPAPPASHAPVLAQPARVPTPRPEPLVAPARVTPAMAATVYPSPPAEAPAGTVVTPYAAPQTSVEAPTFSPTPGEPARKAPTPIPPSPAKSGGKGSAFRETLWFKKGEVEQMVADAKAKAAGGALSNDIEPPAPVEDIRPLEDRYIDDGTVTTDDRKKFSLRTGGTATALPAVARSLPGEKMSASDVMEEIGGVNRKLVVIAVAAGVIVLFIIAWALLRGKPDAPTPKAPTASVAPVPVAVPPPAPSAAPARPIAAPAPTPTPTLADGAAERPAAAGEPAQAPLHKRAAHKKPPGKKHK